jgi:hypothetical protein
MTYRKSLPVIAREGGQSRAAGRMPNARTGVAARPEQVALITRPSRVMTTLFFCFLIQMVTVILIQMMTVSEKNPFVL